MKPVKAGEVIRCESCGVELTVTKSCGCSDCNLVCCGKPMTPKSEPKPGSCCCGR
ncbi:hypothetical protein FJY71_01780 [candidate division WOR-3 bacterium]|nr:hypothetical protein [candidate division WOR-3 bacterium]